MNVVRFFLMSFYVESKEVGLNRIKGQFHVSARTAVTSGGSCRGTTSGLTNFGIQIFFESFFVENIFDLNLKNIYFGLKGEYNQS